MFTWNKVTLNIICTVQHETQKDTRHPKPCCESKKVRNHCDGWHMHIVPRTSTKGNPIQHLSMF